MRNYYVRTRERESCDVWELQQNSLKKVDVTFFDRTRDKLGRMLAAGYKVTRSSVCEL